MKVFIKISLIYTTPTDVPARGVKNKHCSPVCFNAMNFVYLRKYNRCIEHSYLKMVRTKSVYCWKVGWE